MNDVDVAFGETWNNPGAQMTIDLFCSESSNTYHLAWSSGEKNVPSLVVPNIAGLDLGHPVYCYGFLSRRVVTQLAQQIACYHHSSVSLQQ